MPEQRWARLAGWPFLLTRNDQQIPNKNPSPATRWKPGQSGNPSGRPKVDVDLLAILQKQLADRADDGKTNAECVIAALIAEAAGGNVRAIMAVLDRMHGRVAPIGTTEGTLVEVARIIKERLQKPQDGQPA